MQLTFFQGDTVVIPGAGGGLGHLAIQIGSKGMGFRMIVRSLTGTEVSFLANYF